MNDGNKDHLLTIENPIEGNETLLFEKWSGSLTEIISSLNVLTKQTEDQFLSVGSRLHDFYTRSGEISRLSSSLLDCMLGDELTETTRSLENILNRMNAYLGQTDEAFKGSLTTLKDVQGTIHAARSPLESFKKIVKKLKTLSISTKIESAQLKGDNGGFMTLADDVEKLSILIHEKCKNIHDNAGTLNGIIGETSSRLTFLEEKQRAQVDGIFQSIKGSVSSLTDKHERSSKAAGEIAERLAAISKNIGQVVMNMQFHDITRQQIEHVAEALERLAHRLGSGSHGEDNTLHMDDETVKEAIIETGDLCELQSAQLNDALEKFVSAVGNITASLSGIAMSVMDMSAQTKEVAGTADLVSSSFFTNVESGISQVISSLRDNGRASQDLSNAIDNLRTTAKEMSKFVDDIEEIGGEIELIAVNARVKAAHTGNEGAPLGVIAEAIQNLSIEASAQKMVISDMLREIISKTGQLHEGISADINGRLHEVDDMAEHLNELLVNLRNVHGNIFDILGKIDTAGQVLAGDIQDGVSGITVHRQFDRTITGALSLFDLVLGDARKLVPVDNIRNRKDALMKLKQHYTMQSEHDIHESYEGSKVIDLKKVRSTRAGNEGSVGGTPGTDIAEDYGDNVELF